MHLLARLRALPPGPFDALMAAGFATWTLAECVAGELPVVQAIGLTLVSLPLAWRRSHPALAGPACAALLCATTAISGETPEITPPFFALFVGAYSLGAHVRDRRPLVAGIVAMFGLTVVELALEGTLGDLPFAFIVVVGGPFLAGRAMRARIQLTEVLQERTARLDAERGLRGRAAADAERARIAAELQDVVTHRVTAMVVQTAAARRMVRSQPAAAGAAIAAVEDTGREALTEMRRLLGVLRRGDEELALAPQPTLARLDALVARARDGGQPVEVHVEGEAIALTPGVDVAAYRVLQEALANAARNAPGVPISVAVRYGRRELELEIVDGGDEACERAPDAGGTETELLGMRERVQLFGGELRAGPRRAGGYSVRARLPLGDSA